MKKSIIFYCFFLLLLCSCSVRDQTKIIKPKQNENQTFHTELSKDDPDNFEYKGSYKIGNKYTINDKIYQPKKHSKYKTIGIASWYGNKIHKKYSKTANGELFNPKALAAAHPELPLPSLVKVTNLANNKSVIVLVNDRGPFSKNRIIDVTEKVAEILNFKKQGTAKVLVEYLPKETNEFLNKTVFNLEKKTLAKKHDRHNNKCSINCTIKLINIKHKFLDEPF